MAAPASCVYRRLCQLRAAPYSYDLIDNLGRRSPRELTPGLGRPEPGDVAMTIFRVAAREPGREITFVLSPPPGRLGRVVQRIALPSAVTYRVVARGPGASRILVKHVNADPPGLRGRLTRALLPAGDLVMMRRQLMNLRDLAERDARRPGLNAPG